MSSQLQIKKLNTVADKKIPTRFLHLPREVRQSVLHMTYSDSVFKHRDSIPIF